MSARPEGSRASSDASAWIVSPACRALLAGVPFTLDGGPEMRVQHRIAGRHGLLSDVLVLSPSDPRAGDPSGMASITVGDLEAYLDAGLVSCLVDARIAFGGLTRRASAEPRRATSLADRHHRAAAAGFTFGASQPPSQTPGATATRALAGPRFPQKVVAEVVAAAVHSPRATATTIHARLLAGWPQAGGRPPSRSTVERWVRRSRCDRTVVLRGEARLPRRERRDGAVRRWSGGDRP